MHNSLITRSAAGLGAAFAVTGACLALAAPGSAAPKPQPTASPSRIVVHGPSNLPGVLASRAPVQVPTAPTATTAPTAPVQVPAGRADVSAGGSGSTASSVAAACLIGGGLVVVGGAVTTSVRRRS